MSSHLQVMVLRKRQEALDITSFELARPDGSALPAFSAGAHIDVQLPGRITRQYSLCNAEGDDGLYRIAVLRDPQSRGGSHAMHDAINEGDLLDISPPRNQFPLVHARKTLLFAGGIGVTPMLCMAQRLHRIGADFRMHYCTRSAERTAFRDEIAASPYADRVCFHHDDGDAAQKLQLDQVLARPEPDTHIYVCGPAGFIEWVVKTAERLAWSKHQVHLEYFGATPQDTSGDRPFQVKIASSGETFDVGAAETVALALQKHGIDIPLSCEQGVCGTCITRVLQGECDHRDLYFTDEEKARNDQFTPCCSRAHSPLLVLDL